MEEVYRYLLLQCQCEFVKSENAILFDVGGIGIHIVFVYKENLKFGKNKESEDEEDEEDEISFRLIKESDIDYLNTLRIKYFSIVFSEDLRYREDYDDSENPKSYSISAFKCLRYLFFIQNNLKEWLIGLNAKISFNDSDLFCGGKGTYDIELILNPILALNKLFFQDIIYFLGKVEWEEIENFFTKFFPSDIEKLEDNHNLLLIPTHSKVRRLGYLKIFSNFIKQRNAIQTTMINQKFESFAAQYSEQLKFRTNDKGLIQEEYKGKKLRGRSAEPYINFFKELGLINEMNKVIVPIKELKVYNLLNEKFFGYENNPLQLKFETINDFDLNLFDKAFFLELVLKNDFIYFFGLLELIFLQGEKTDYQLLKNDFQKFLLIKIESFRQNSLYIDTRSARLMKDTIDRINDWKKPKVYLEHIIMPRLNWLADLELINLDQNKVILTKKGKGLFYLICQFNDLHTEWVVNPKEYIDSFYISIFNQIFIKKNEKKTQSTDVLLELVEKLLNEAFEKFTTLAPNRITASLTFDYIKYALLINHGFAINFNEVKELVEKKLNKKFIYKFQPQYEDGYIQKRDYELQS